MGTLLHAVVPRFVLIAAMLTVGALGADRHATRTPLAQEPSAEDTQTMNRLRFHLLNISQNAANHRVLMGTLFFGTAALLSGTYIAEDRLLTGEPKTLAEGVLGVSGGLALIGALGFWLFPSEEESVPEAFLRQESRGAVTHPIEQAEGLLRRYALRAHDGRTVVGGLFLAMGAADLAWHFAEGATPNTAFLVYKGALFGAMSLYFLFVKWPKSWNTRLTSTRNAETT